MRRWPAAFLAGNRRQRFLAVVGPGIVVMLADTDAGSIVTAAQSGAEWGYRLLLLQFLLMPILSQEWRVLFPFFAVLA